MDEPPTAASTPDDEAASAIVSFLRRARRRLYLLRLSRALSFDLVVFLSLFAAALFVEKLVAFGVSPLALLAGFVGASVVFSVARSRWQQPADLHYAAAACDQRLELKERLSSAVYLLSRGEARDSGWERLICRDGAQRVDCVELGQAFPLRVPRSARWICLPLVAVGALFLWMPTLDLLGLETQRRAEAAMQRDLEKEQNEHRRKLSQLEARAKAEKLDAMRQLLAELRKSLTSQKSDAPREKLGQSGKSDPRKQALIQLARQEDRIRRTRQSARHQSLKNAMERMRSTSLKDFDVASKLARALKRGDFRQAQKEIKALADKLQGLSRSDRQKLAQELSQLAMSTQDLAALSQALAKLSRELQGQDLQASLDGMRQLSKQELEELAKAASELELMKQALDLVKASRQNLQNLHKCPNCGKNRMSKPGAKPGGT